VAGSGLAGAQHKARMAGRTSVVVDESGVYLWPGLVRTSAPCGQPPILRSVFPREHVSVLRAIPMDGRLATLGREAARDSLDSGLCRTPLRPQVSEPWLVIWDGSPIHQGPVRTLLAEGGARPMHRAPLPPAAPALYPGEGVWPQVQNVAMRHLCGVNRVHRRRERGLALKRWRRMPHVLTACCAPAGRSGET
jgi:hypothetical protein